jgi:iron complex transport system substrate-binding protein
VRWALRGCPIVLTALFALPCAAASAVDDRGVAVSLRAPAQRIVTLAPHLTEIAYAAGAGERLAATVRFSDYPAAASGLARVGDAARIDVERVLALKPHLVLGWRTGNPGRDLQRLEALGLTVFVTEPRRLADVARLLRSVGALADTARVAEAAARHFENELAGLEARYGGRRRVRVFYEIWHRPLLTVSGAHVISDILRLCGGENVFADAAVLTPAVSYEAVLARRPDVILGGSSGAQPEDLARGWARAPVAALRAIPVRFIDPDLIQRQSPRLAQGARAVCEALDALREQRKA